MIGFAIHLDTVIVDNFTPELLFLPHLQKLQSENLLQHRTRKKIAGGTSARLTTKRNAARRYTCQLSRLRVENCDLTPAQARGSISHAWLKNVSCCRLAWHNFQKYVNSDPRKERKPCVKWINYYTFLPISDFWSEKHWERARLRQTSDFFGNLRKWSCRLQKPQHSQD